jgi:hypothetical protein
VEKLSIVEDNFYILNNGLVKNSNLPLLKGVNFSTIVEICQSEPTNHTQDTAPVHTAFVLVLPQRQDALLLRDVASKDAQSLQLN